MTKVIYRRYLFDPNVYEAPKEEVEDKLEIIEQMLTFMVKEKYIDTDTATKITKDIELMKRD